MDSSPLLDNIDSEKENGVQETQEEKKICDRKENGRLFQEGVHSQIQKKK